MSDKDHPNGSIKPSASEHQTMDNHHEIYVPGYKTVKLWVMFLGLAVLLLSLEELWPAFQLFVWGKSTRAEAYHIVMTQAGGKEFILKNDTEVLDAIKTGEKNRDWSSFYWVEYAYNTSDGQHVEVRSPLGQRVKPLHMLTDADGLPQMVYIWYDPSNPKKIMLPLELGSWFLSSMLLLFGTLGTFSGFLMWYHANDKIEMPDLSKSHAEDSH